MLGGNVLMKQLRMPQHDPALLRLNNLSSSELVSAVNPKQFAMSGAFSGALPLWLNNEKWIVKDGWLANSGPMTLRLDKDTRCGNTAPPVLRFRYRRRAMQR